MKTINEKRLDRIVKESINEMLNAPYRDTNGDKDGAYRYQGTGSPASKERVDKISNKWKGSPISTPGEFDRHGRDDSSPYRRRKKEYGPFKDVSIQYSDGQWALLIEYLRNLASAKYPAEDYMLDGWFETLRTKEGAASFIKYLYMNGFDQDSR